MERQVRMQFFWMELLVDICLGLQVLACTSWEQGKNCVIQTSTELRLGLGPPAIDHFLPKSPTVVSSAIVKLSLFWVQFMAI